MQLTQPPEFLCNFIDGAYLEIKGDARDTFIVEMTGLDDPELALRSEISANQWVRTPHRYFIRWCIRVFDQAAHRLLFQHDYDNRSRRVYISMESSALGDTLAWLPAVERFGEQWHCRVVCSTFFNGLFRAQYPGIEFIEPGEIVEDVYAHYRLGWFYQDDGECDYTRNVRDFRQQSIGRSAYDILGLDYAETRPRLKPVTLPRPLEKPYVCIGFHATAQAKYWNNAKGWEEVIRFLHYKGYKVILLSHEGKEHMGNKVPKSVKCLPKGSLDTVINYLNHARLFIGIGSGLSWLSWATGCRTCLISGFSYPYTEMRECIRIFPKGEVCSGCFNRYRLNQSDWNWCPDHKNTSRMFECTRLISGRQVIEAISPFL